MMMMKMLTTTTTTTSSSMTIKAILKLIWYKKESFYSKENVEFISSPPLVLELMLEHSNFMAEICGQS